MITALRHHPLQYHFAVAFHHEYHHGIHGKKITLSTLLLQLPMMMAMNIDILLLIMKNQINDEGYDENL